MGSFAAAVDLAERLRPWAQTGLSHLYLPEGLQETVPDALGAPVCADNSPASAAIAEHAPTSARPASQPLATASGTATGTAACTGEPPIEGTCPAPASWPAPWSTLAARVRTRPRVIITYASLADDVTGNADPARRKLFQSILSYLAWPQGTTLFWPISFPTGVEPGERFASDIFAEGVRHYGAKHVLCFGEGPARRARTLFPPEDKDVAILELAAPEQLLALLPHELHQALAKAKGLRVD